MSGDRLSLTDEDSSAEDEQLSQLVAEFEGAIAEGRPTDTLELRMIAEYGERAISALQGLKSFYDFDNLDTNTSAIVPSLDPIEPQTNDTAWIFGRFQVLERLGAGGHGVVFRVFDSKLNRDAALKVPRPDLHWQPGMDQRFLKEARAAAALDHPHILPIYDTGQIGGVHFILSAYCSGPSLAQWLADQKGQGQAVCPQLAARWLMLITDGIEYSHSKGIAHRDLKPGNIMLEPTAAQGAGMSDQQAYRPRICDFGLSKSDNQDQSATLTDAIRGTLAYMAPEQTNATMTTNVFAFDIYALGAILFEMLTGRPPLVGQNQIDLLRRIGIEDPPLPGSLRPGVPRDLEAICMKCLDRDPIRRYPTARELSHDLSCFLTGERIAAPKVHRSFQYWKSIFRRHPPSRTVFSIAGMLAMIAAAFVWQHSLATAERQKLTRTIADVQTTLSKERVNAESRSQVASSQEKTLDEIYVADIQRANRIWHESRGLIRDHPYAAAEMKELLVRHVPVSGAADRRGFEWYYLWRCCEPERFVTPSRRVGKFVGHLDNVYAVEFTPDAKSLVTAGGDRTIRIWDVETQELRRVLIGHTSDVNGIAFSGNGELLASASDDGTVRIWDFKSGQELLNLTGHQSPVVAVAFHIHLPLVASGDHQGVIKVWDIAQKSEVQSFKAHSKRIQSMSRFPLEPWASASPNFISCGDDAVAKAWDFEGPQKGSAAPISAFEYDYQLEFYRTSHCSDTRATLGYANDDRSKVVFFRADNSNRFDVESAPRLQTGGFTVDDSQFLIAGRDLPVRAVDIATRKSWSLTESVWAWSMAISRDGRYFATGEKGGSVTLWDCSVTPQHIMIPDGSRLGDQFAYSPDGQWMFVGNRPHGQSRRSSTQCCAVWNLMESPPVAYELTPSSAPQEPWTAVLGSFASDGNELLLVSADSDGKWTCHLFDLATRREKGTFPLPLSHPPEQIAFDDKRLDCVFRTPTNWGIFSFDSRSGNKVSQFNIPGHPHTSMLSADGRYFAVTTPRDVLLYDVASQTLKLTINSQFTTEITSLAFSAQSDRLALGGKHGRIKVIDTGNAEVVCDLRGDDLRGMFQLMCFSADAKRLITGEARAQHVHIWSIPQGDRLLTLRMPGQNKRMNELRTSPDGKCIAAAYTYMPLDPALEVEVNAAFATVLWQITGNEAPVSTNR